MHSVLRRRSIAVVVLLGVLIGLCVWFGTLSPAPGLGDFPQDEAAQSPAAFVGQSVELGGTVVETTPLVVELDDPSAHRVTVTGVAHPVAEGDTLRLFGTLIDPETVRVTRSFAVPPSGATYTYSVSFLAGLWVLGRLLSHWRLDPTRGLVRRSRPLRPTRWLRRRARDAPSEEAETDA